jgi:hypothetical protein
MGISGGCDLRFGYQRFVGFAVWISTKAVIWVLDVVVEQVLPVWDFLMGFLFGFGYLFGLGVVE